MRRSRQLGTAGAFGRDIGVFVFDLNLCESEPEPQEILVADAAQLAASRRCPSKWGSCGACKRITVLPNWGDGLCFECATGEATAPRSKPLKRAVLCEALSAAVRQRLEILWLFALAQKQGRRRRRVRLGRFWWDLG